jgi:hypothetical protein
VCNFACADGDSNLGEYFLGDDHFQVAFNGSCITRGRVKRDEQAGILRELFGPLPFRPLPPLTPSVLQWNGGTMKRLAEAAYEHRDMPAGTLDLGRLAVLADALEEAGCQDQDILSHLRQPGQVHIRGCFVLDLLLGKK